jgi:hypothetical protein
MSTAAVARPIVKPVLFAVPVLLLLFADALPAAAGETPALFTLTDPLGDDHGDGNLRYPVRSRNDMLPGQLDLVTFAVRNEKDGTMLEATFSRPITRTQRVPLDDGGTLMTDVIKLGFYTFNIDVYLDTDGIPGSGNTHLLPGRNAEIGAAHAWEKAVCLTPLPNQAESLLNRTLAEEQRKVAVAARTDSGRFTSEEKKEIKEEVLRQTAGSVFFPTRVEILGRTIRFFVPMSFLGGPAKAEWGWVIAVSGADVAGRFDLGKLMGMKKDAPIDPLFIMRAAAGRSEDTFGGADEDDPAPCPLIDIIVPPGTTQEKVLGDYNVRKGLPVRLPAVVPAALAPPAKK